MSTVINIAAYKFAALGNLSQLRQELRGLCQARRLKGTILLSSEGVNLFVAGDRDDVDALLTRLRQVDGLRDLQIKESRSKEQPFNRMLVKIKRQIIPLDADGVDPARYTSRRLSAAELKRWLDEGRPVTLLDVRNNFEVNVGAFENAVAVGIDNFRDFTHAARRLPDQWKRQPVVTYCTGGIRCEKAGPALEQEGFQEVYQLDGGILKYFEECGGDHYRGACFVFDRRVALDARLQEVDVSQCFNCQAALTAEDRRSERHVEGKSCVHCYVTPEESLARLLKDRQSAIRAATSPLPGSVPYENLRPIRVPQRCDGMEALEFLDQLHTRLSRDQWRQVCQAEQLHCNDRPVRPGDIVRAGQCLLHRIPATIEPDVNPNIVILHEDEAIVVVDKPAPLPVHPCGRFNRNTLLSILGDVYAPLKLRAAHRLDADTSGVVVLSKMRKYARLIQPQFERGAVKKTYGALVHGRPAAESFEWRSPIADRPGNGGVRLPDKDGLPSTTRFRVIETFGDRALLEVEPTEGRTNQIRIHLWEAGFPIVGDPIYLPDGKLGCAATLQAGAPPLCLHAAAIEFLHPLSDCRVRYESAERGFERLAVSD